jgi:hypothetical protein
VGPLRFQAPTAINADPPPRFLRPHTARSTFPASALTAQDSSAIELTLTSMAGGWDHLCAPVQHGAALHRASRSFSADFLNQRISKPRPTGGGPSMEGGWSEQNGGGEVPTNRGPKEGACASLIMVLEAIKAAAVMFSVHTIK